MKQTAEAALVAATALGGAGPVQKPGLEGGEAASLTGLTMEPGLEGEAEPPLLSGVGGDQSDPEGAVGVWVGIDLGGMGESEVSKAGEGPLEEQGPQETQDSQPPQGRLSQEGSLTLQASQLPQGRPSQEDSLSLQARVSQDGSQPPQARISLEGSQQDSGLLPGSGSIGAGGVEHLHTGPEGGQGGSQGVGGGGSSGGDSVSGPPPTFHVYEHVAEQIAQQTIAAALKQHLAQVSPRFSSSRQTGCNLKSVC